jgi:type IV secretory pathway component VirB8
MFNILLNTLIDAAPLLLGITAFYAFIKVLLMVAMAPVQTYGQPYVVSIGAHTKRLSALE